MYFVWEASPQNSPQIQKLVLGQVNIYDQFRTHTSSMTAIRKVCFFFCPASPVSPSARRLVRAHPFGLEVMGLRKLSGANVLEWIRIISLVPGPSARFSRVIPCLRLGVFKVRSCSPRSTIAGNGCKQRKAKRQARTNKQQITLNDV